MKIKIVFLIHLNYFHYWNDCNMYNEILWFHHSPSLLLFILVSNLVTTHTTILSILLGKKNSYIWYYYDYRFLLLIYLLKSILKFFYLVRLTNLLSCSFFDPFLYIITITSNVSKFPTVFFWKIPLFCPNI